MDLPFQFLNLSCSTAFYFTNVFSLSVSRRTEGHKSKEIVSAVCCRVVGAENSTEKKTSTMWLKEQTCLLSRVLSYKICHLLCKWIFDSISNTVVRNFSSKALFYLYHFEMYNHICIWFSNVFINCTCMLFSFLCFHRLISFLPPSDHHILDCFHSID